MTSRRIDQHEDSAHMHSHRLSTEESFVKDPVCGMKVNPTSAKYSCEHDGRQYFFCGQRCLTKFQAEPTKYLQSSHEHRAPEAHPQHGSQRSVRSSR